MINVRYASEPGDVKWKNIGIPVPRKIKIRIITILLTIGLLIGSFLLIFYLSYI